MRPSGRDRRTPGPLSFLQGVVVWLDPAYSTVVGGVVTAFQNRAPGGGSIAQATATKQVAFTASDAAYRGAPSVLGQFVAVVGAVPEYPLPDLSALTQGELFVVGKSNTTNTAGHNSGRDDCGTSVPGSVWPETDNNVYEAWGSTVRKSAGVIGAAIRSPHLYNVWSAPSDYKIRINRADAFTTATNTVAFPSSPKFGASAAASASWLNGSIASYIICNKKQTASARAAWEQWCLARFGL